MQAKCNMSWLLPMTYFKREASDTGYDDQRNSYIEHHLCLQFSLYLQMEALIFSSHITYVFVPAYRMGVSSVDCPNGLGKAGG